MAGTPQHRDEALRDTRAQYLGTPGLTRPGKTVGGDGQFRPFTNVYKMFTICLQNVYNMFSRCCAKLSGMTGNFTNVYNDNVVFSL